MNELLIDKALEARELSYSPYSHYKVGAAVLLRNGTILKGANIENAAYGSTMCGERNAIYHAYCSGYRKDDILALAISSSSEVVPSPCGACRQVIIELLNRDVPVYLVTDSRKIIETSVEGLLPLAFDQEEFIKGIE